MSLTNKQNALGYENVVVEYSEYDFPVLYVGILRNDCPHKYGMIYKVNCGIKLYEGGWLNGTKHGYGKEYYDIFFPKLKYNWGFYKGLRNGMGKSYHTNGKVEYSGWWEQNNPTKAFAIEYSQKGDITIF